MRFNRRLMISLLGGVAAVSVAFAAYQTVLEVQDLSDEVQRRALVIAKSQQGSVEQLLQSGSLHELHALVERFHNDNHMAGLAIYDENAHLIAITPDLASRVAAPPAAIFKALRAGRGSNEFLRAGSEPMHVFAMPLIADSHTIGAIGIFQDAAFLGAAIRRHGLVTLAETVLIVGMTLWIVHWSLGKPLRYMAQWLRDLRTGDASAAASRPPDERIFEPLTTEVAQFASSLNVARAAAQEEARLRDASLANWTSERLRVSVQGKLNGNRLFVLSNREPYEHVRHGNAIACSVPPSGLVTALEPVLRACDGTWVAQATGDADLETADDMGRLRVPPDHPQYQLRRVWLSDAEQQGFYFGFANEGLWPLCHIAHTRPVFRIEDWSHYCAVNRKFAAALLDEMRAEKEPFVLVQDYHFALLPRMVKESRPEARVAIFWHIPWPNPEAFGICPWQRELLDGMLGADLIGFHIQAHCNNFLQTVDRALESRIDGERFAVNRLGHTTAVRPFPISVAFSGPATAQNRTEAPSLERAALFRQLGIDAAFVGLGVDRIDYTKGIPERLRGIERLFEQYPFYQNKLTFIQIGAPSRTHIKHYQDLIGEVQAESERINLRFRNASWRPIVFLDRHHSHEEIQPYYREADFCLVTSLHDGMNLVSKEYVAARHDEGGVLILSRFTGASHELADALVVNPYDTDELAQAIHTALAMPASEKRNRMQRMRAVVQEHNVYRWAGTLIAELAGVRLEVGTQPVNNQDGNVPALPLRQ